MALEIVFLLCKLNDPNSKRTKRRHSHIVTNKLKWQSSDRTGEGVRGGSLGENKARSFKKKPPYSKT